LWRGRLYRGRISHRLGKNAGSLGRRFRSAQARQPIWRPAVSAQSAHGSAPKQGSNRSRPGRPEFPLDFDRRMGLDAVMLVFRPSAQTNVLGAREAQHRPGSGGSETSGPKSSATPGGLAGYSAHRFRRGDTVMSGCPQPGFITVPARTCCCAGGARLEGGRASGAQHLPSGPCEQPDPNRPGISGRSGAWNRHPRGPLGAGPIFALDRRGGLRLLPRPITKSIPSYESAAVNRFRADLNADGPQVTPGQGRSLVPALNGGAGPGQGFFQPLFSTGHPRLVAEDRIRDVTF